jgi:hypothetical protein
MGEECSGGLFFALTWTIGKAANFFVQMPDFFVRIVGETEQGDSGAEYA